MINPRPLTAPYVPFGTRRVQYKQSECAHMLRINSLGSDAPHSGRGRSCQRDVGHDDRNEHPDRTPVFRTRATLPPYLLIPASASAICAPMPIPPQISASTFADCRKPASAPCPLPFVSTICSPMILPSSTSYSLKCSECPKCWNTIPFS